MAFSKITTKAMSGDTLEAGDIAANSIGASELADNAVDTAAIASEAVTAPKVVDGLIEVKPHIKPGTLYPAWSGLLEDNTGYTFTDSGNTGHTITPAGNIYHSGVKEKIGATSINFDGTGDYLSVADHADFDISGQFTIECWVNVRTIANYDGIITFDGTGSADFVLGFGSDSKLHLISHAGNATSVVNSGDTINLNRWYHVAVSRDGSNNTRFYLDGVHKTVSTSYTAGHTTTSGGVKVGRYYTADDEKYLDGFLDELRVSNTARYTGTSSFTPSTSAFSSDANTKLLIHSDNGGHSGAYGTAQSDGKKYYYTDIKGSKPIKDPRIGAYFGSQRYTTTSLQLLEQETATHGSNIYSVDGREWMRVLSGDGFINYAANGHQLRFNSAGMFLEIVGYFNGSLIGTEVEGSGTRSMEVKVDGVVAHSSLNVATATLGSPLINRYVDSSSLRDIDLTSASSLSSDTTLGIHTLKLSANWSSGSHNISMMKIELIAQDTTSTANKSKIQIPTQNVVSYGKKFAIPTTAQHYDPFNGFTSGSSVTAYVDTTTSLGIEGWKNSSTYYRPYNGGRVVKWVDSSGTIKTSVNMMPPNAKSIKNADISKKANASVANNTYLPTFEAGTIDHSQAEVAKTFHWREFGNGAANGGAGSGNADASMLNADDDISYVMDDGLTSFSAKDPDKHANYDSWNLLASAENGFYTFIGTGFAIHQLSTATCTYTYDAWVDGVLVQNDVTFTGKGWKTLAQNLPYGSHIIKFNNTGTSGSEVATFNEVSFHQPKMPPIPEDACIIADYMLMADFVPHTTQGHEKISKGSRYISASRDFLHDAANGTLTFNVGRQNSAKGGLIVEYVNPGVNEVGPQLTWFGDAKMVNEAVQISDSTERSKHYFDGATTNVTVTSDYTDSGAITTGLPSSSEAHYCVYGTKTTGVMGKQISKFVAHPDDTSNDWLYYAGAQVSTPIHTSSHYQTFETPHLLELVGGDRNMEQTNLIVTSDGKSWDEVTRDTSYIGDMALQIHSTTTAVDNNVFVIMDECRGYGAGGKYVNYGNKDFAIAYDRQICLKDGEYEFFMGSIYQNQDSQQEGVFFVNGNKVHSIYTSTGSWGSALISGIIQLKRGDYVQIKGGYWQHNEPYYSQYYIKRLK